MENYEVKPKKLVCVRFPAIPASYIFDAQDLELANGDLVLVNTESGLAVAKVLGFPSEEEAVGLDEIKSVVRKLTEADRDKLDLVRAKEQDCFRFCAERIRARNLPMKLTRVEQMFDGTKITFSFVAEGRVDFRELLKDLVEKYRTRIELRQIGSRQESAMLGGIGSCGRELCCAVFLTGFQRISVKMAKNQNMTLNPTKISGLCGKLKCCLAYEKESYANLIDNLPKPGKKVFLEQGEAFVVSINIINQSFVAKLADRRFVKCKVSDILTEEEYSQLGEQKAAEHNKPKEPPAAAPPSGQAPERDKERTRPKRRRSSRQRNAKKKRSKPA
ncbi:MAG TPA: regulatory iron-sulfur-containing complex subunit RicT [Deltaproteobacteria bacterium]|nr:regulatory iron-sulfur-containing complex subunit RicT [Deltaproteobacteria bacterium]HQI00062.1 regulatory iron-sulfur-containing complex subunit RicT [Deltaproteobacteria bacterium]HQJ07564.1 regulatory iron-sulfur-containing complex subunit RicT [Deltaproteobacteria bacterium]